MVQNPLAPLFNTARQLTEQTNLAARSLGDSLTQSTNAILAGLATGVPGVPGVPAGQAGGLALPFLPPLPGIATGGSSHLNNNARRTRAGKHRNLFAQRFSLRPTRSRSR